MKKMRRLIPAIAMLLVSAVMLSTASFAWFTMNEEVTASGMQIQAKADGSLLISQAPFTVSNLGGADVEVSTGVKNLKPITYGEYNNGTTTATGWNKPTDNKGTNIITGSNTGAYEAVTSTTGYTYKEEFYIATAGEALSATTLKVVLTAPVCPSSGETHKAYAAAIYVVNKGETGWNDGQDIDFATATPSARIFVGESGVQDNTETRNTVSIANVTIPSVASITGSDEGGVKIIVHFYVDGALQSPGKTNEILGYTHNQVAADTTYVEGTAYYTFTSMANVEVGTTDVKGTYVLSGGTYIPTTDAVAQNNITYYTRSIPVASDAIKDGTEKVPTTWYTAGDAHVVQSSYTYVRSADIPSNGSTLKIAFSSADVTAAD